MGAPPIVTFLSDYGLEDEFVGVCHGVMQRIASDLQIIDIDHNVMRQHIRHGAVVLAQSIPFMPEATHLAVVDPSVGSERKAVAIRSVSGRILVGPDNGLLIPGADVCGGIEAAFELSDERYLLTPVSQTFQGRDVFAPAAAHIASGVDPAELGPPVEAGSLIRLEMPEPWVHDDHLHGEVLQVDRFGNLQLNIRQEDLGKVGLTEKSRLELRIEGHRLKVTHATTFSDVDPGDFVVIEDSYRFMSLAISNGDARARLRADAGSTVIVGPLRSE
jgi:S-adenosyl-L-methionine hydrolase (adenosine-forming)